MRFIVSILAVLALTGGCRGVNPSSVSYAAPAYQAVVPQQSFGVQPEAKAALMIPADLLGCFTSWCAALLQDTAKAGYCALNTVTPPAVIPVVPVQYVPVAAPAASPCAPAAAPVKAAPCAPVFTAPPPPPAPVKAPCEPVAGCENGACGLQVAGK